MPRPAAKPVSRRRSGAKTDRDGAEDLEGADAADYAWKT